MAVPYKSTVAVETSQTVIQPSTTAFVFDPYGKTIRYTLGLKSRWPGDTNPIRTAHLRAISKMPEVTVASPILGSLDTAGTVEADAGNVVCTISTSARSPLSHSRHAGLKLDGGTGYVKFKPGNSFRVAAFLIKPNGTATNDTARITAGDGATGSHLITLTKTAVDHQYTIAFASGTVYINGASVTTASTVYIPFPVLMMIDFGGQKTDLRFGNTYTGTGTADKMQIDHVTTMTKYTAEVPVAFAAGDFVRYANLFYRKGQPADFVSLPVTSNPAVIVPNPMTWPVVSSS
jgi:hypothetical protein